MMKKGFYGALALAAGLLVGCGEEASTMADRTATSGETEETTEVEEAVVATEVVDEGYTEADVAMLGKATLHKEVQYDHLTTVAPLRVEVKNAKLLSVEADDGAKHMVKNAELTHFVVVQYSFTNISDKPIDIHNDASYIVTSHGEQVSGYAFEGSFTGGVLQPGATKHGEINFETLNSSESVQYFTWYLNSALDAETYEQVGKDITLELEMIDGSMDGI